MKFPTTIASGDWSRADHLVDFRSEWLSDVLVERATWAPEAPSASIEQTLVRAPGYVWFRFWITEEDQLVEKYFDDRGESVGIFVPICTSFKRSGTALSTKALALALWHDPEGRVLVLNEDEFDRQAQEGQFGPVEVEHAEFVIRKLTSATAQNQFPPALVRNFSIQVDRQ
ncbi:MAG: DUF402 domain-containing protein [Caldilineaceae bacterium]|nr:DUF402 domain-containing protein [Caldilineaceae bacterium]